MLERTGLEDNRKEGVAVGVCDYCKSEIMEWEEHYDIEGVQSTRISFLIIYISLKNMLRKG